MTPAAPDRTPAFSVVVPMYNAEAYLPRMLAGLKASSFQDFELLLVDDGSTDGSRDLAQAHGVTPLFSGGQRGAGPARNVGVEQARAPILVFVDADVVLHETALARMAARFEADPTIDALMGSYDDAPAAPSVVSRFRNLLHAWFHGQADTEASTFWTGLGAVRREAFDQVGGFSTTEIIEDIEFGVRLKAEGRRIVIDPAIQGTHLKDWTLDSMVRTDLFKRGVPWIEMVLRRGGLKDDLNTGMAQRASVAATAVFLLAVAGALAWHGLAFAAPAAGIVAALFLPMLSPGGGRRPGLAALGGDLALIALPFVAGVLLDKPAVALPVGAAGLLLAVLPLRFDPRPGLADWVMAAALAAALVLSLATLPLSSFVVVALAAWAVQVGANLGLLGLMYRRMGPVGLLASLPLLMIYHLCCGLSVIVGFAKHRAGASRRLAQGAA